MADIKIELATIDDAMQIAVMSRDLVEKGLGWSWTRQRICRAIRSADCNVVVFRAGKVIAGFGIMQYGLERAHLLLFAVRPEIRRKRVGSRLLEWLVETALVAGVERIDLETRYTNSSGRDFYRAHGFREIGTVPGYYSGREGAVRMSRQLREASDFDLADSPWAP